MAAREQRHGLHGVPRIAAAFPYNINYINHSPHAMPCATNRSIAVDAGASRSHCATPISGSDVSRPKHRAPRNVSSGAFSVAAHCPRHREGRPHRGLNDAACCRAETFPPSTSRPHAKRRPAVRQQARSGHMAHSLHAGSISPTRDTQPASRRICVNAGWAAHVDAIHSDKHFVFGVNMKTRTKAAWAANSGLSSMLRSFISAWRQTCRLGSPFRNRLAPSRSRGRTRFDTPSHVGPWPAAAYATVRARPPHRRARSQSGW